MNFTYWQTPKGWYLRYGGETLVVRRQRRDAEYVAEFLKIQYTGRFGRFA